MIDRSITTNARAVQRLEYRGVAIETRREQVNLTNMWKAEGGPEGRRPDDWKKDAANRAFLDHVALISNAPVEGIWRGSRGNGGSTFAHWQIGLAYAKYLSPEFHMWCNTVVRERMEGKAQSEALTAARHGGITKAVVQKALADMRLIIVSDVLSALTERGLPSGQFYTSMEFIPALSVIDNANVPQRGRGGLVRRASNALDRFCRREGTPVRSEAHTERRLFHVDAAKRWMEAEGRAVIQRHMDRLAGQAVMQFPGRTRNKPFEPREVV